MSAKEKIRDLKERTSVKNVQYLTCHPFPNPNFVTTPLAGVSTLLHNTGLGIFCELLRLRAIFKSRSYKPNFKLYLILALTLRIFQPQNLKS